LKKITYSLRIGFIGNKQSTQKVFLDNLRRYAISSITQKEFLEFLIVFNEIPINIKTFLAEDLDEMAYNFDNIEKLDVIIFIVNLFESDSLNMIDGKDIQDFIELFSFQGITILVGFDIEQLFKKRMVNKFKISRFHLEKKAKDLDFFYCYEIYNNEEDVSDIYNKIFKEFLFRFQYSSSKELWYAAKNYGKELLK